MRPLLKYLLPLLFALNASAQLYNLVPNPGFETYHNPNFSGGDIENSIMNWFSSCGSPDLFNENFYTGGSIVPNNIFGYQQPNSGIGFIGMQFYYTQNNTNNIREYAGVKLLDTLKKRKYYYEFYISYTLSADQSSEYAPVKNVQIHLSKDSTKYIATQNLSTYIPDSFPSFNIYQSNYLISDTVNWVKVFGTFIANGNEQYLYIGNFYPDSLTEFEDGFTNPVGYSYYYIDDVLVAESDTVLLSEEEIKPFQEEITLFPNPATNTLTISTGNLQNVEVALFDISGRKLFQQNLTASQQNVDVSGYANGVYICTITANGKVVRREKIVISR